MAQGFCPSKTLSDDMEKIPEGASGGEIAQF